MLDGYIIDAILREEQRRREDAQRARLELPLERWSEPDDAPDREEDDTDRGVVIIPLNPGRDDAA